MQNLDLSTVEVNLTGISLTVYMFLIIERIRLKDGALYNKVGISVSKKVGNSVVRRRTGRSYRLNCDDLKQGFDFYFCC